MSASIDNETIKAVLFATKKTGKRNYLEEYPITVGIVSTILKDNGYPSSYKDDLTDYAIDLAGTAVFIHKMSTKGKCNIHSCMRTFSKKDKDGNYSGSDIITDTSWNKAIDNILNMLKNRV